MLQNNSPPILAGFTIINYNKAFGSNGEKLNNIFFSWLKPFFKKVKVLKETHLKKN